jgi:hypothetical protein
MKLSPIVLKLRAANITKFENRIAGAAEFAIAQENTLLKEMAFVVQLAENASSHETENHINQTISEGFAVIVALKNDTTQKDKTGLTSYDSLFDIRAEIWKAILGWQVPGAESLIYYLGGRLLIVAADYLWYQFEFGVDTHITMEDAVNQEDADSFDSIFAQYLLAPDADNLPLPGGRIPTDIDGVDMEQIIDFTT